MKITTVFGIFCIFFADSARVSSRLVSKLSESSSDVDIGHPGNIRDDLSLASVERRARKRKQTRYTLFTVESPAGYADINFEATIKFVKTCLDLVSAFDHYPEIKFHVDRKHKVNLVDELPYRYSFFSIDLAHNNSIYNFERISDFLKASSDFVHSDKIELLIKTSSGRTIAVIADTADTIQTLKSKIAQREGVPAEQQILEYEGRQLDDQKRIFDYNLRGDSRINMKHSIDIRVKLGENFEFTIAMLPTETVTVLKSKLAELNRLGLERIHLNFHGINLENTRRLVDYNVTSGSLIQASIEPEPEGNANHDK